MIETRSLDDQYLEFREKTASIFAEFPLIEPLRYFIFRDLLQKHKSIRWKDISRFWLRSVVRRPHTQGKPQPANVLVWIAPGHKAAMATLLPLCTELEKQKIAVQIIAQERNIILPPSTLYFKYTTPILPPTWARKAWDALTESVPSLRDPSLIQSFVYACAAMKGRFSEIERLLDIIQPDVILDASTGLAGGAAWIIASRSRNILSLEIQHGITQVFYTPLIADYMVTWGESSDKTLTELGVSEDCLIPLGSPRHDLMVSSTTNNKARTTLLDMLSLPEKPTFVFFSNGNDLNRNGNAPTECAQWLESVAAEYKTKINFVVRLHPKENGSLYQNCSHLHITKNTPDLATTLEGCDWIGSLCSTVLYEALLYNKPVWHFDADHWPDLAHNWKLGLAVRINSLSKLQLRVKDVLEKGSPPFGEKTKNQVFANHGRASQAIVDFIQTQFN